MNLPDFPLDTKLLCELERVAKVRSTVLIEGETGTGKTTIAKLIHRLSGRAREPFVRVDCAGLVSTLAQAELFGHERNAFTDAKEARPGLIRSAGAGTVFLDEIGVLGIETQARLLTFLEERTVRPVGGTRDVAVPARILCATNEDLRALSDQGKFRMDLYQRCATLSIRLPPLRERREEMYGLLRYLVQDIMSNDLDDRGPPPAFSVAAMSFVRCYSWPGNLRELRAALLHALVHGGKDVIEANHLPPRILALRGSDLEQNSPTALPPESLIPTCRYRSPDDPAFERRSIVTMLLQTGGNLRQAARLLGMSRSHIYSLIARHGIAPAEWARENDRHGHVQF